MGIRFYCPNGHKLNVKDFLAGRRGICPFCGASVQIPLTSTRPPSGKASSEGEQSPSVASIPGDPTPQQADPAAIQTGPSPATPAAAVEPVKVEPAEVEPRQLPAGEPPAAAVVPSSPAPASPAAPPSPPAKYGAPPAALQPLDPFAEAPDAVWYVRPQSGGQFGPATAEVMRTWLAEGRIAAGSLVWREGWRDWQDAAATFPQLAADEELSALSEIAADAGSTVRAIAAGHHPPARRRDNTTNITVIVVLVLAVIVLLVVFYYVVM
jgi:hypothetical protein